MAGMVYLVGAGPGDHRLLTLKGKDCLAQADVVVYDRLVDARGWQWAPAGAEFVDVGKAASNHTMPQPEISQLLVDKAKEGKTVVRLKGGDPYVFGRGGEEGLLLRENGIDFEVVPGITSAVAVPSYAGIPVTHRAVATSFAVITGHEDPTKEASQLKWDKLATGVDTLIFLMGLSNLPYITQQLIANGRPADTPAAVIRWGTRTNQRVLVTTVGTAAADVEKAGLKPPAIFIVGEVVKYRDQLDWFDRQAQRPLFGHTVLVTRARAQASRLSQILENMGARVIELPAITITPPSDDYEALDAAIDRIDDFHWLVFTSVNGVEQFFARMGQHGLDTRALGYARVAAIGRATAEALQRYGIKADLVPDEYRAEKLAEALQGQLPPHAKVLLARAEKAREVLPEKLQACGAEVTVAPAYATQAAELDEAARQEVAQQIEAGDIDIVTFTSSSTVENLIKLLGIEPLQTKGLIKACIGPITADKLRSHELEPEIVAAEYTIPGLVNAIEAYLQSITVAKGPQ